MHQKSRRIRRSYPVFAHLLPDDTELSPQNKTGKCDCKKAKDEDGYCNQPSGNRLMRTLLLVATQIRVALTENWDGSPSEFINVPSVSSHVPRSAKYLHHGNVRPYAAERRNNMHSNVLNTVRIIITKKPRASKAC